MLFYIFLLTFPSVACFRCRQRPLYRREIEKVFGGGILFACKGRFLPKRHSRPTFSLSKKSVLTLMDGRGNMRLAEYGYGQSEY